jgi:pimeloyl-ACP methyl ester carboxylesterase
VTDPTDAMDCEIIGHGPRRLIAFGGWIGGAKSYTGFFENFDRDEFSIAIFEYRGYGKARSRTGHYSFDEAAKDALQTMDALGWQDFSLVGHSMGGMAMQHVLLHAPERVVRMIGIAAVSACGSHMPAGRLALFERAVEDIATRARILDLVTGGRLPQEWSKRLAHVSWHGVDRSAIKSYLKEWAVDDISERVLALAARNSLAVKLFVGQHDPIITQRSMIDTFGTHYINFSVEMIENAGHYPTLETPLILATRVQDFLRLEPMDGFAKLDKLREN